MKDGSMNLLTGKRFRDSIRTLVTEGFLENRQKWKLVFYSLARDTGAEAGPGLLSKENAR